ncbi:MAG: formate dehydrogenase accessory protein FdhE [Smithellaceae bacterium]|nr:formate dehydrogenase accessory protein FdhE [Smithellaceae bacterium]
MKSPGKEDIARADYDKEMKQMAHSLKDALVAIEKYKNVSPHYSDLLDILGEIMILREDHQRRIEDVIFPVDESLIAAKMEGGLPLVDFFSGRYDLTQPREYFLDLLAIAESRAPGETKEIAKKIAEGTLDFDAMICDSFQGAEEDTPEDEAEEGSFDLISLFVEESLRPALSKVVERYGDVVAKSPWTEGYCPICGREPKIGEISEEGPRFLFCSQCGYEWHFQRIKCPFCGNEEQQSLAYFSVEEDERYRVDVCNVCKRYIKTVDLRDTGEKVNLDVEDIATLHLDMLANEEGYE